MPGGEELSDAAVAALRERYRVEREKRLRADGNEQYLEIAGEFAHFAEDRYAPVPPRPALVEELDAVVVGGGFGGLMAAAALARAGCTSVRVIEKGGRFGGTWYWNQYPGAQCDIESYIYLPLLEELGAVPSEKYVRAPEILAHVERIAAHYQLGERALFGTAVTELRWDDDLDRWHVATSRGDELTARFVVTCTGPLHRPKLPGVEGINEFEGISFHTSRWDYDVTGGDPNGGLDRLAERRVAIIGTGATAVQVVPHLAAAAKQLYVFQRTPSAVDERGNAPTDPSWVASLAPGWQRTRNENFNGLLNGQLQSEDLVNDGWTALIGRMVEIFRSGRAGSLDRPMEEILELANMETMEAIRARVDREVHDPEVAERLKPYYKMFCKRPCFSDDYLAAFNRANVTLVDTDGKGVQRITPRGVVANGIEYEVDLIVYATGFEVGTGYERRAGLRIVGRDGRTLTEKWSDGGIRTLHGMHTHDFPNLFIISQFQAGFTANYTHLLAEATRQLEFVVHHALREGFRTIEATTAAERAWADEIAANAVNGTGGIGGTDCTPGYYNNEGRALDGPPYQASYGKGSVAYFALLEQWRADERFEGLAFTATAQ